MKDVSVVIEHSKLKKETWDFYLVSSHHLCLDEYRIELRESTRHKFRIYRDCYYNRLDKRISTISVEQVILDDRLIEMAKKQLYSQITVSKYL